MLLTRGVALRLRERRDASSASLQPLRPSPPQLHFHFLTSARIWPMAAHLPGRPRLPSIPSGGDIDLSWPSGSSSQDHYGAPAAAASGAPPSPLSPTSSDHSVSGGGRIRAGAFGRGSRSSAGSTSDGDRVRRQCAARGQQLALAPFVLSSSPPRSDGCSVGLIFARPVLCSSIRGPHTSSHRLSPFRRYLSLQSDRR